MKVVRYKNQYIKMIILYALAVNLKKTKANYAYIYT